MAPYSVPDSIVMNDAEALAQAVRLELHSFHYFELFLGMLFTGLAAAGAAWVYWERIQRVEIRQVREAAVAMMKDLDATTLKRVLGQVLLGTFELISVSCCLHQSGSADKVSVTGMCLCAMCTWPCLFRMCRPESQ